MFMKWRTSAPATILRTGDQLSASGVVSNGTDDLDITIDIGGWRPVERLNLTGGENGVNPVGRPHLPGVNFDTDFIPWYFLILAIGAASLWAMNRMRDSRLGRAWMAIREDETAAAAMGIPLMRTKTWAYAAGAFFGGVAGAFHDHDDNATDPHGEHHGPVKDQYANHHDVGQM